MNVEWQSGWIFRILCWLALWAFGLVSGGLLLFGILGSLSIAALSAAGVAAPVYGTGVIGPGAAVITGILGLAVWFVLCRVTRRADPAPA